MARQQSTEKTYSQNRGRWQAHAKAQQKSGLSRAEYCRQHKLSYHALAYWQKKVAKKTAPKPALVPVKLFKRAAPSASGLKIIAGNHLTIEVEDHFTPATLAKILRTLEMR
jgi:hypothetical protein